jgi:hypothetical protein
MSEDKSGPTTTASAWDLRHPGLVIKDGEREVHEFTGMWPHQRARSLPQRGRHARGRRRPRTCA